VPGRVVAVGLGPAGADHLLPVARAALETSAHRYARTLRHPAIDDLVAAGVTFESFDEIYDAAPDLETAYADIAGIANGFQLSPDPSSIVGDHNPNAPSGPPQPTTPPPDQGYIYIWPSVAAAQRAHDEAWRQSVIKRTGGAPTIRYFDLFMLIDNEKGAVTEFQEAAEIQADAA